MRFADQTWRTGSFFKSVITLVDPKADNPEIFMLIASFEVCQEIRVKKGSTYIVLRVPH